MASRHRLPLLSCLTLFCGFFLQGCNVAVPRHTVGNWEAKPNYLTEFQYVPPGKPDTSAILNSCMDPAIATTLQCSGHGSCRQWNDVAVNPNAKLPKLAFCECDRDYADPECTTPRKSQVTAFVLSLFLVVFGVDQFYLGYVWYGVAKLLTVGGLGLWYLFDLCRIGSTPPLTRYNFRAAADLPHFAFVLTVVTAMLFFGFAISIWSIQRQRVKKAHELLLLRMDQMDAQEEEAEKQPLPRQPVYSMRQSEPPAAVPLGPTSFSGYGATLPRADTRIVSMPMVPPVTLPPVTRSFTPPVSVPVVTRSFTPPIVTGSMTPPMTVPVVTSLPQNGFAVLPTNSLPLTEYTIPRAVPTTSLTSPVLPVLQGMTPPGSIVMPPGSMAPFATMQTSEVRPVSSTLSPRVS